MSVGARVFTQITRPDPEVLKELGKIPVANLDDNMGRIYAVDSGIKSLNGKPLCGPAFTVKCPSGDNLMFHKALELAQPGDIIVVSGVGNSERSFSGELMLWYASNKGLGGFVIDGYVRDLDGHLQADFPVYVRGIQPNGPFKNGPGEVNVPVAVGGQAIMPGDALVGDEDGLIVVPRKDIPEVLAAGKATFESEEQYLQMLKNGAASTPRQWVADKLAALNVEIIEELN